MTAPVLWQRFTWRGRCVMVIQQWADPYGRPMLRFSDPDDGEMALGMPVDDFMVEATPLPG